MALNQVNDISLVSAEITAMLQEDLRQSPFMPRLFNSEYNGLARQRGNKVVIPTESKMTTREITQGVTPPTPDTLDFGEKEFTFDYNGEMPFLWSDIEYQEVSAGILPQTIRTAFRTSIAKINQDCSAIGLQADYYYQKGSIGSAPTALFNNSINDFTDIAKIMNDNHAPQQRRIIVCDTGTYQNMQQIPNLVRVEQSASPELLREGDVRRVMGFDVLYNTDIPTFTKGNLGGSPTATGTVAAGSETFVLAPGATGTLKANDLIQGAGDDNVYRVKSYASATRTVTLASPTKAAWSANAAITVVSNRTANVAFQRDSIALIPFELPTGGNNETYYSDYITDPESGFQIRWQRIRQHNQTYYGFDWMFLLAVTQPAGVVQLGSPE